VIEPDAPRPAVSRGHGDLDRLDPPDLAAAGGAPGEGDVTLPGRERRPYSRELEATAIAPPHVRARRIDQLELQVVGAARAADLESELVVLGEREVHRAPGHGVSCPRFESEIETHRASVQP